MRILIAYDGSECSDAALEDLTRAGLPPKAEVLVLSVSDVWLSEANGMINDQEEFLSQANEEVLELAHKAKNKLQKLFPSWKLCTQVLNGSPASTIVREAKKWNANMIVMGSHGRSLLGRIRWGSVSQSVVTHAHCSVRISREQKKPRAKVLRLVIGMDGSLQAKAAVENVASRIWPARSEIRVIAVFDPNRYTSGVVINIEAEKAYKWFEKAVKFAEKRLCEAGIRATGIVMGGNPKHVLIREAEKWNADCVIVGARGLNRLDRILLLGSVSTAVAMRARCSVEIVRA